MGTDVFGAIADPTRRQILALLAREEMPVKRLSARFAVTRPAVSKHLRLLKEAGLVAERKAGRQRFYRLRAEPLSQVDQWLRRLDRFWAGRLLDLKSRVEGDLNSGSSKSEELGTKTEEKL